MKIKIIKIVLILLIILTAIILAYVSYGIYIHWQAQKLISQIFPETPAIKDIPNAKPFSPINLSNIYYPNLIGENIYYFDNSGQFRKADINTNASSIVNPLIIAPSALANIKSDGKSKLLIGKIYDDLIALNEEEALYDLKYNDLEYYIYDISNNSLDKLPQKNHISEAFWDETSANIILLINNSATDYQIDKYNLKTKQYQNIIKLEESYISTNISVLPGNCLYLMKEKSGELYSICLNAPQISLSKIAENCNNALISPDNKYALINKYKNKELSSAIIDLQTKKQILTVPYIINLPSSVWSFNSERLIFITGENLKVGEETKDSFNRRASYVFFQYTPKDNNLTQLTNHYYRDPLDANYLMLARDDKELYFINTYLSSNILYKLTLE